MTTPEIIIVLFGVCFLGLFTILAVRKHRKNKVEIKPDVKEEYISPSDRAYMRQHNLLPKQTTYIKPSAPATTLTPAPAPTVVYRDSGPDLLTQMILMDALTSKHDTTSGTVTWKDETPTIHRTPDPEPTPSYSSSYSSSSDDSSSRSSYSSSSSSDSYSSSSSDSSYSSSSSSDW